MAHPDDETLWAGGLIHQFARSDVDVVCCSVPQRDPIRAVRFFDAVRVLGGFPVLVPAREPEPNEQFGNLDRIWDLGQYEVIFTHNKMGEYGHLHHQSAYAWVRDMAKGDVWTFGYGLEERDSGRLADGVMDVKMAALRCYDHVSPVAGIPKWQELVRRWGSVFDLRREWFERV